VLRSDGRYDLLLVLRVNAFGGSERHTVDLADFLAASGRRVALVLSGGDLRPPGILTDRKSLTIVKTQLPVRDLTARDARQWRALFRSLPAGRAAFAKTWYRAGDLRFLTALRKSYATVFHIEHSLPEPLPERTSRRHFGLVPGIGLWWYAERWRRSRMSKTADRFIVVCAEQRRRLIHDAGVPESAIAVCPNGVELRYWRCDEGAAERFRRTQKIPAGSFVFGCVGRLAELKGFDLAIRAFAVAGRHAGGGAVLCVAGDGPHRGALERLSQELVVGRHVRFLGATDELREVYSATDTVLLPSRSEACPLVLLEGMASGCRVIASDVGGIPEMVTEPVAGTVLASRDADEWAAVMRRHMAMPSDDRRRGRERIRELVGARHDMNHRMGDVARVLMGTAGAER